MPTRSMTGFARTERPCEAGLLTVEIRSVNHRYLEPSLRLPDRLRMFEGDLRDQLRNKLQRGKVDCFVRLDEAISDAPVAVNGPLLLMLNSAIAEVRAKIPDIAPADPLDVLRWPGVLQTGGVDEVLLKRDLNGAFGDCIKSLIRTRETEGADLQGYLLERLEQVEQIVLAARDIAGDLSARLREKLCARIAAFQDVALDPGRLEQEVSLLAQKADVDEELDRLTSHIAEIRRTLVDDGKKGDAIGRRLDFLMQEVNREANTLASKATQMETTIHAVDLKLLVEQMREQIQNIE